MCLIIVNPMGEKLPDESIENGWRENSDGAGYMFVADGKLILRKPFFKLKDLRSALNADHTEHGKSSPFIVHFRWATHGEKIEENCHPHPLCGGNAGLVHNGVLRDFLPPYGADHSDTVHFCRTVLAYRRPADVMDETFRGILAEMIGKSNKLALLSHTGEVSIVNEAEGVWDNGNWYSNTSYKSARPTKSTWKKEGKWYTPSVVSTLPAAYRRATAEERGELADTLFGRADVWDKREEMETELDDCLIELEELDVDGFNELTPEQQEHYIHLYHRSSELERELDSRLH